MNSELQGRKGAPEAGLFPRLEAIITKQQEVIQSLQN